MARPLPSLNQLRAFEVAARHLSFSKAAEELYVTPAAVSHHIRSLEAYLNLKLFERLTRRLELTEHGRALLPVVGEAFGAIATEVVRMRSYAARRHISVSMPPFLSAWWLAPRLSKFLDRHPGLELSLNHTTTAVNFDEANVDLAVHWLPAGGESVASQVFFETKRVPVGHRAILVGKTPPRTPSDIRLFNLLHEFSHDDWEDWYRLSGLDPKEARRGFVFDNYEVLIRAAMAGHGLALLMSPSLTPQPDNFELVKPFGERGPKFSYSMFCQPESLKKPIVREFQDWLLDEVSASPAHPMGERLPLGIAI